MAVITISRQFGAGGKTLGEMLVKNLGYTLFDHELIQLVSETAKVSEKGVEFFEKESSGIVRNFIRSMVPKPLSGLIPRAVGDMKGEKKPDDIINEEVYVDVLHDIIRKIAEGDNAVIIGRAAQYILKDRPNTFHILATANIEDRESFLVDKYGVTPQEAAKAVEVENKRRLNLYRKFGKDDYDKPHAYHLVINTSKINLESGCELICELIKS
jgi:Cytidylate kinase-like family